MPTPSGSSRSAGSSPDPGAARYPEIVSESVLGERCAVIIEDDPGVRALLDEVFQVAGFVTVLAGDGADGIRAVQEHRPLITTLDVNLPGIDGFEVARRLRRISETHIIMISALADESDAVLGLTSGADDYLIKPFRPRELRARIEAALRRPRVGRARAVTSPTGDDETILRHHDIVHDLAAHTTRVAEDAVDLTPTEFDLLTTMLESRRRVRTRADLAVVLRGDLGSSSYVGDPDKRAVEVHMANLRRKIGDSSRAPRYIETVRGVGYRLTATATDE